jgi:hypothetical protein
MIGLNWPERRSFFIGTTPCAPVNFDLVNKDPVSSFMFVVAPQEARGVPRNLSLGTITRGQRPQLQQIPVIILSASSG